MIRALAVATCGLLLTGCTPSPEQQAATDARADARLASAIGDRVPGTAQDCIDPSLIDGPQVVAPKTVIYRENASRIWVSTAEGCPSLRATSTLIVDIYGSNLCRNDRFRTIDPGSSIPGPYCRFGPFTPFDKPR
ncbi:hypothetical protein [Sphingomonas japonica]|uniref:Lipoprotein n=1 Tax=Sphingomonas japonica TaxID=511662 RepID=A0ABX0U1V4_9SPHN|nr:hypothetical protein [Sphingomonas japonica]NIJ23689.1 hypothetical protein [Sphingomonas japonica]